MKRLQISLTEAQYEFLKAEAFLLGKSMAAVLRDLLDAVIQTRQQELLQNDPIWDVIGVGAEVEGPTDASTRVDRYLYGEFENADNATRLRKIAEEPDDYAVD